MKLLLPFLLIASVVRGQTQEQVFPLPTLKDGLYTRYSANVIPDGALSDALNVTIDEDVDGVVVARRGYSKYNTSAITDTRSVRGLWTFDATDGTKYFISFSSQAFYKSSGDGTWAVITGLTGFSSTKEFDCTQTIGKFWCGNGDVFFSWDGTSTATISGAPLGNLVGRFRNRVLISGVSGSKGRLRGSGELDGTDYVLQVPGVSTTPFNIAFGGADDGEDITCLMGAYQDAYIVGKRNSLWGLYGFGRTDFQVRELSREVGCIDEHSAREKNGCLYWLSLRGIEKMCGPNIARISDPIRDQLDTIVATAGNPRSTLDTTQSDFQLGNLAASGPGAAMSATIVPASVVPSSWGATTIGVNAVDWMMPDVDTTTSVTGYLDNFDDGNLSSNVAWTAVPVTGSFGVDTTNLWVTGSTVTGGVAAMSTPSSSSSGTWSFVVTSTGAGAVRLNLVADLAAAFAFTGYRVSVFPAGSITSVQLGRVTAGSEEVIGSAYAADLNDGMAHYYRVSRSQSGFGTVAIDGQVVISTSGMTGVSSGVYAVLVSQDSSGSLPQTHISKIKFPLFYENQISRLYDIGLTTPTYGSYAVTMSSVNTSSITFTVQSSTAINGSGFSALVSQTPNQIISATAGRRSLRHHVGMSPPESATVSSVTAVSLTASTTGYFISQCRNPSTAITKWGIIACNTDTSSGGSITIAIATGSSCGNAVSPTTAPWTTQTNNTTISVATAPYVAYRLLFTLDSGTQVPKALDCTINWSEGETRPPVASSVYRDRYYMAYTSSTASGAANDHILVLDKNDKWTLFDQHSCYSLVTYERKLYCGSSTNAGQVWRLDNGTDDDGSTILSRIRTKAFNLGMPERRKSYTRLYLDLEPSPDSAQTISLTGRYTLERSTPTYSLGAIDLNEDPGAVTTAKAPFQLTNPTSGRYIQLELESNALNSPWRLYSGRLYFNMLDPE